MTFWRRRFGAAVLAPPFCRRHCAITFAFCSLFPVQCIRRVKQIDEILAEIESECTACCCVNWGWIDENIPGLIGAGFIKRTHEKWKIWSRKERLRFVSSMKSLLNAKKRREFRRMLEQLKLKGDFFAGEIEAGFFKQMLYLITNYKTCEVAD